MTSLTTRRAGIVAAATLAAVLALASPALAHTEISLDPAQAGAPSATLKVKSEAESDTAGIKSVQMFMPQGVDPSQVTLAAGPEGWTLQNGPDNVTVTGTPLAVKVDAEFSLKLGALPATATELTFKTLVTYTDGKVDRWIGAPNSDNPAPTVSLAPAGAVITTAPAIRSQQAQPTPSATPAPSSSNSAVWWILGIVALLIIAVGVWMVRSRRNSAGQPPV